MQDIDIVLQFLEDRCERDEYDLIKAKALYDVYKSWCRSNGYYVCNIKRFIAEVTAHPEWYDSKGLQHNAVYFSGLKLREE